MLALFVLFTLFPPDVKYLKRFNDLIMLKQVITKEIQTSLLMPKKKVFLNLNSWQEALKSRF